MIAATRSVAAGVHYTALNKLLNNAWKITKNCLQPITDQVNFCFLTLTQPYRPAQAWPSMWRVVNLLEETVPYVGRVWCFGSADVSLLRYISAWSVKGGVSRWAERQAGPRGGRRCAFSCERAARDAAPQWLLRTVSQSATCCPRPRLAHPVPPTPSSTSRAPRRRRPDPHKRTTTRKRTKNPLTATMLSLWWPSAAAPRNDSPWTAFTSTSWRISRTIKRTSRAGRIRFDITWVWISVSWKCRGITTIPVKVTTGCWIHRQTTCSSGARRENCGGGRRRRRGRGWPLSREARCCIRCSVTLTRH